MLSLKYSKVAMWKTCNCYSYPSFMFHIVSEYYSLACNYCLFLYPSLYKYLCYWALLPQSSMQYSFEYFFSSVLFCITVSAKSLSASAHPLLNLVAFVAFSIEFRLFKHFQVWVLRGLLVPNRPQNSRGE